MKTIENLKWRYATKKFDSTKKINDSDLSLIQESIQLSASSFGLQLFKVLVIKDEAIKEKLKAASFNQAQLTDASHILVFCNYAIPNDKYVDEYITNKASSLGVKEADLMGYGDYMKGAINGRSNEAFEIWTAKQTYIALGTALEATAELKIDSCPMEGFEAAKYNDILGLKEQNLKAAVVAAIGYRSAEDATQHQPKVRKSTDKLFELI